MTKASTKKLRRKFFPQSKSSELAAEMKRRVRESSYEERLGIEIDGKAIYNGIERVRGYKANLANAKSNAAWAAQQARDAFPSRWGVIVCVEKEPDDFPEYAFSAENIVLMKSGIVRRLAEVFGLLDGITRIFVVREWEDGFIEPEEERFAEALLASGAKLLYDETGAFAEQSTALLPSESAGVKTMFDEVELMLGLPEPEAWLTAEVRAQLPERVMELVAQSQMEISISSLTGAFTSYYWNIPDGFDIAEALTFGREECKELVKDVPYKSVISPFQPEEVSDDIKANSLAWQKKVGTFSRLSAVADIWEKLLSEERPSETMLAGTEDEYKEMKPYDMFEDHGLLDECGRVDMEALWEHVRGFGVDKAVELYLSGEVDLEDIVA